VLDPVVQTLPAMQSVRVLRNETVQGAQIEQAEDDDVFFDPVQDSAVYDEAARLMITVRDALAQAKYNSLRALAHPLAIRREQAWLARVLGPQVAADFWAQSTVQIEAVRIVAGGLAEVYEHVRHHRTATSLRLVSTVEHVQGRWRMTDAREATDERVTAVLLRGAPPEDAIDTNAWNRAWNERYGQTAALRLQKGRGDLEHPVHGWKAMVRNGSGRDLARQMALTGPSAELLEKQPAATIVSLVPSIDARDRTRQLQWIARAVSLLGQKDASSVWVPSAAKAVPFSTWRSAAEGPLELASLSALWLRTQRQRGAWVTRGMTNFMLPEIEIWCAGLSLAMVRALLRDSAGRLLRHHKERMNLELDGSAGAVPAIAPRLYTGTNARPVPELPTAISLSEMFEVGEVECGLAPGRQGPRPGESYGRWGSLAIRPDEVWWSSAA
jgi:hypothetical protein